MSEILPCIICGAPETQAGCPYLAPKNHPFDPPLGCRMSQMVPELRRLIPFDPGEVVPIGVDEK